MEKNKPADMQAVLKSELAKNKLRNFYIFYGEEYYLREHYISRIKDMIVSPDESNFHLFSGNNMVLQNLSDAIMSYPLTSEKKLILLRDYDIAAPDAQSLPALLEILSDIPEFSYIIVAYAEGKPGGGKTNKKMEALLKKTAFTVEFPRPNRREYEHWIVRRFAALGKTCGRREAERLGEMCGGLMYATLPEIEKIAAYSQSERIMPADIDAVTSPLDEVIAFEMTNCICVADAVGAVASLQKLYERGSSATDAVMETGRAIRRLYAARLSLDGGIAKEHFMKATNIRNAYAADIALRQARRFKLERLRKAAILCDETEQILLRGRMNENVAMESLLYSLSLEQ